MFLTSLPASRFQRISQRATAGGCEGADRRLRDGCRTSLSGHETGQTTNERGSAEETVAGVIGSARHPVRAASRTAARARGAALENGTDARDTCPVLAYITRLRALM